MSNEKIILEPNEDGVYVPSGSSAETQTAAGTRGIKSIGRSLISIAILIAVMLLALTFIKGGVWVGEKIYPGLAFLSKLALFFTVFILMPLTLFQRTKAAAGIGIFGASYVFGLTLWVWSLTLTYKIWGIFAVIIGLFFAGVGIVPVALLATLFKGEWSTLAQLIMLMIFVPVCRTFGLTAAAKAAANRK